MGPAQMGYRSEGQPTLDNPQPMQEQSRWVNATAQGQTREALYVLLRGPCRTQTQVPAAVTLITHSLLSFCFTPLPHPYVLESSLKEASCPGLQLCFFRT